MLFETAEHLKAESLFAKKIEEAFKCRFHKMPIKFKLDGWLSRNKMGVAVCELKCRNVKHETYPTVVMSKDKLVSGLKLAKYCCHPFTKEPIALMIFIRYLNGDYYAKVTQLEGYREEILDPKNHGRFVDKEKVVHIPVTELVEF